MVERGRIMNVGERVTIRLHGREYNATIFGFATGNDVLCIIDRDTDCSAPLVIIDKSHIKPLTNNSLQHTI